VPEDYVHRIGRTARAGEDGHAISLVCVDELKLLREIEKLLGTDIPKEIVPGYEVDPSIKAEPIKNGRSGGGGGGNSRGNSRRRPGSSGGRSSPYKGKSSGQRSSSGGNRGR
jgi:ATP-dependent RNA helicase RhlE